MICAKIANIFLEFYPATLTVAERWQAARNWDSAQSMRNPLMLLIGILAIIVLMVLLIAVRSRNTRHQTELIVDEFNDTADRYGLSTVERRAAMAIARLAGLQEVNAVFTSSEAYSRGAAKLMQERYLAGDSVEERRQLKDAIASAYNKLGFGKQRLSTAGLSSRHIKPGKQVLLTRRPDGSRPIEATVEASDEVGLTLNTGLAVNVEPGQVWTVKYLFGVSTWQFESPAIGGTDGRVVLAHCDRVRFTNRRRFLRVPVRGKALIARYPFQSKEDEPVLPQWQKATVTELAGPGLRLDTNMAVQPGERLLVVINIDGGDTIRDVAEVRHIVGGENSGSMAVELVTLGDAEVSTLVRLTNAAARNAGMQEQKEEMAESDHEPTEEQAQTQDHAAAGVERS